MNILKSMRSLMLFVLLGIICNARDKAASPHLELMVSELKPSNLFPGGKAYSATIKNTTSKPIPIELIQLPSGYSGGGTFYPCSLQLWNIPRKQWQTLPPGNKRSARSSAQFLHSEIKPDETIEVCRKLLTNDQIKGGKCARFAFTFQWDHKPDILSKPFVISDRDKSGEPIPCPPLSQ